MSKPWWEIHFIENTGEGQSVLIPRIHHSLADGIALVQVFGDLIKTLDGKKLAEVVYNKKPRQRKCFCSVLGDLIGSFFTVAGVATSRFDTHLPFNDPTKRKLKYHNGRSVIKVPNSLAFVKAIKNAAGCSVNDVVFSATAGAIRKYCLKMGTSVDDLDKAKIRALLPVAFPRRAPANQDPAESLRNHWTMVSSPIPLDSSAKGRIERASKFFNGMKQSALAGVAMALNNFVAKKSSPWRRSKDRVRYIF